MFSTTQQYSYAWDLELIYLANVSSVNSYLSNQNLLFS